MYVTAHRVKNPITGQEGVNTFLRLHKKRFSWPEDPSGLPETNAGKLSADMVEVPLGGNRASSYLDVIAPDETPVEELQRVLSLFAKTWVSNAQKPVAIQYGKIVIRFGVEKNSTKARQRSFRELRDRISLILKDD